jgi:uncharacterized membrane protein YhaH (DUF805 family)
MNMVYCRGCAKEIHSTATACPQCGAQQATQAPQAAQSAFNAEAINSSWYVRVLKKYAVFAGRASRKEYWMFALVSALVSIGLIIVENLMGSHAAMLSNLYSLAVLVPSIAVGVRRLHDTDRSGWWLVLPIVNIVFLAFEGQRGGNRFGEDPKLS